MPKHCVVRLHCPRVEHRVHRRVHPVLEKEAVPPELAVRVREHARVEPSANVGGERGCIGLLEGELDLGSEGMAVEVICRSVQLLPVIDECFLQL